MKKRKNINKETLKRLRRDVETFLRRDLSSPEDFNFLNRRLQDIGQGYISATTLKRVWGYITDKGEDYSPSNYTLRALVTLIGFKSFEEYCNSDATGIQSGEYMGEFVDTVTLPQFTEIIISWSPNRKIKLRKIAETEFEVIENENSRLKIGDRLKCASLTSHAPAFFRVIREGITPFSYVAGTDQGILFTVEK